MYTPSTGSIKTRSTPVGITGIVLAGGRSRRMGGGHKGFVDLAGTSMLRHVITRFRPQVDMLAINANGDPALFMAYGFDVFSDMAGNCQGPLAGILAGMAWARQNTPQARWIATVPTDSPFLPLDMIAQLNIVSQSNPTVIVIPRSNGYVHPVAGLWPLSLSSDLVTALDNGVRKVQQWTNQNDAIAVDFPFIKIAGRWVDPFFNVNTPRDLDDARSLLTATGPSPHVTTAAYD